jgi:hypothetical protein
MHQGKEGRCDGGGVVVVVWAVDIWPREVQAEACASISIIHMTRCHDGLTLLTHVHHTCAWMGVCEFVWGLPA